MKSGAAPTEKDKEDETKHKDPLRSGVQFKRVAKQEEDREQLGAAYWLMQMMRVSGKDL